MYIRRGPLHPPSPIWVKWEIIIRAVWKPSGFLLCKLKKKQKETAQSQGVSQIHHSFPIYLPWEVPSHGMFACSACGHCSHCSPSGSHWRLNAEARLCTKAASSKCLLLAFTFSFPLTSLLLLWVPLLQETSGITRLGSRDRNRQRTQQVVKLCWVHYFSAI